MKFKEGRFGREWSNGSPSSVVPGPGSRKGVVRLSTESREEDQGGVN